MGLDTQYSLMWRPSSLTLTRAASSPLHHVLTLLTRANFHRLCAGASESPFAGRSHGGFIVDGGMESEGSGRGGGRVGEDQDSRATASPSSALSSRRLFRVLGVCALTFRANAGLCIVGSL